VWRYGYAKKNKNPVESYRSKLVQTTNLQARNELRDMIMLTTVHPSCVRRANVSKLIFVHENPPFCRAPEFPPAPTTERKQGGLPWMPSQLTYHSLYPCRASNVMSRILASVLGAGRFVSLRASWKVVAKLRYIFQLVAAYCSRIQISHVCL
jgi:hypothetical protein